MTGNYIQAVTWLTEQNALRPEATWEVKEHKEKRSLSQNSYYWKLITEVARRKKQSVAYTHNYELRHARYAKWFNDKLIQVCIPDTDDAERQVMEAMDYHLTPTRDYEEREINGEKVMCRIYVMLRGSSELNTAEFAHLLDLLIQDAQALGIETLTYDQLAEMRIYEQRLEDARKNKAVSNT
jgi:hypothetical protein